jgi:hypothetical protein
MPSLCKTSWPAIDDSYSWLLGHNQQILEAIAEESNGQAASDVQSYTLTLDRFSFIISAELSGGSSSHFISTAGYGD